jgi:hypothetical protein
MDRLTRRNQFIAGRSAPLVWRSFEPGRPALLPISRDVGLQRRANDNV